MIYSFLFFLLIFTAIGALSAMRSTNNNSDYLLASQNVKPWLVALSAVATHNSGFMFIGMIGFTYEIGLSSAWFMIGWVLGDFISSFFIHKKIRIISQENKILSFAGLFGKWGEKKYKILRAYLGVITIVFLGTYAAAQLSSGSKALNVLLGWDYSLGAIIGAIIVLIYCFAGGIRASIWTDAAQSIVMMAAMILLCFEAMSEIGGVSQFLFKINNISDNFASLMVKSDINSSLSLILFAGGWFCGGLGIIGQPHIMIRFMTMDNPKNMPQVRIYYYSFFVIFWSLTIWAGLLARILIPDVNNFDAELALPTLANSLLPQILVGVILAGLFAATMSTADSQILSCSASMSRDFSEKEPSYFLTKISTIIVTIFALLVALFANKNVFDLVLISWSALAVAFGPLLLIRVYEVKISEIQAIIISVSSILAVILWRYCGLNIYVYEVFAGFLNALLMSAIFLIFNKKLSK